MKSAYSVVPLGRKLAAALIEYAQLQSPGGAQPANVLAQQGLEPLRLAEFPKREPEHEAQCREPCDQLRVHASRRERLDWIIRDLGSSAGRAD